MTICGYCNGGGRAILHGTQQDYPCPFCKGLGTNPDYQTEHESLEERGGFWDFIFSIGR